MARLERPHGLQIDQALPMLICREQNQGVDLIASTGGGKSTMPALLLGPVGNSASARGLCALPGPTCRGAPCPAKESHSPSLPPTSGVTLERPLSVDARVTSVEKGKTVNKNTLFIGLL